MAKSNVRSQKRKATFSRGRDGLSTRSLSNVKSSARFVRARGETLQSVYTLGKELGFGSFGVTYKCRDKLTGEKYACKSIAKYKQGIARQQSNHVTREVQIMQRLAGQENIVHLKEVYEDEHSIHLIMERCFGGELFDRLVKKVRYGEKEASCLCKKLAEVVQACHFAGVIHRDIKLENILFVTNEEDSPIRLIDFGASAVFEKGEVFHEFIGTPSYTAPEVYKRHYSKEADIWSLGIILYTLLCGQYPFQSFEVENSPNSFHASFDFSPWEKISAAAKDLIKKMLEHDPGKRFTADEVLRHPWIQLQLVRDDIKITNLGPPKEHGNMLGDRLLEVTLRDWL